MYLCRLLKNILQPRTGISQYEWNPILEIEDELREMNEDELRYTLF